MKSAQNRAERTIAAMQAEFGEKRLTVIETLTPLKRGDTLTAENTVRKEACSTMQKDAFVTDADLGSRLLVDVGEGIQLLKVMVSSKVRTEEKEVECEAIILNDNRQEHDIVDVRIRFPNGEDYIVLAKKELLHVNEEVKDRCYLQCEEDEIALLSGAYVDALLYPGTCLYTAKYPVPALQEEPAVTYVPSADAIEAMKNNPNIVNKAAGELMMRNRKSLEERLADSQSDAGSAQIWERIAKEGGNYTDSGAFYDDGKGSAGGYENGWGEDGIYDERSGGNES